MCEREAQEYQEARVRQLKVRSQDERMNERSFRRERDLQQNIWDCLKKQSKLSLRKNTPQIYVISTVYFRSSIMKFQKIVDELGSFFIILGYCGEFILGAEIQDIVKKFINDLEHEIYKIW